MPSTASNFNAIILLLCLITTSCASKFDESHIIGSWTVDTWKKAVNDADIEGQMDMNFDVNGTYSIDYGSETESGKYWFFGDYLHTVETGQSEKKVKIVKLQSDSFLIQMNRAGSLEEVLLLRK